MSLEYRHTVIWMALKNDSAQRECPLISLISITHLTHYCVYDHRDHVLTRALCVEHQCMD